jgi:transposase
LQVLSFELVNTVLLLQVASPAAESACPLWQSQTSRIHSHYTRKAADLACGGHQVQLIVHVRQFFCVNRDCPRKIFVERLTAFLQPWARLTSRLGEQIEASGLASCGRLGARLGSRLKIETSRTSILGRIMKLATKTTDKVVHLGVDDFSFRHGRTFGTVLVDLQRQQIKDLLAERQKETTAAWMKTHPEITHLSRDRGSEYASAASAGAPQAIQVADRFHVAKNLSEAVQQVLARVLLEMKTASQGAEVATQAAAESLLPIEEGRPAQEESVKQTIATRRAERQERSQQVLALCEQGLRSQEIAVRLGMKARTVRDWLHKGVAPDTRPRRKYPSEFEPYAP